MHCPSIAAVVPRHRTDRFARGSGVRVQSEHRGISPGSRRASAIANKCLRTDLSTPAATRHIGVRSTPAAVRPTQPLCLSCQMPASLASTRRRPDSSRNPGAPALLPNLDDVQSSAREVVSISRPPVAGRAAPTPAGGGAAIWRRVFRARPNIVAKKTVTTDDVPNAPWATPREAIVHCCWPVPNSGRH